MNEETVSKGQWSPTHEQFDAYEKREVELAVDNLKKFGDATLHSSMTVAKARTFIAGK